MTLSHSPLNWSLNSASPDLSHNTTTSNNNNHEKRALVLGRHRYWQKFKISVLGQIWEKKVDQCISDAYLHHLLGVSEDSLLDGRLINVNSLCLRCGLLSLFWHRLPPYLFLISQLWVSYWALTHRVGIPVLSCVFGFIYVWYVNAWRKYLWSQAWHKGK